HLPPRIPARPGDLRDRHEDDLLDRCLADRHRAAERVEDTDLDRLLPALRPDDRREADAGGEAGADRGGALQKVSTRNPNGHWRLLSCCVSGRRPAGRHCPQPAVARSKRCASRGARSIPHLSAGLGTWTTADRLPTLWAPAYSLGRAGGGQTGLREAQQPQPLAQGVAVDPEDPRRLELVSTGGSEHRGQERPLEAGDDGPMEATALVGDEHGQHRVQRFASDLFQVPHRAPAYLASASRPIDSARITACATSAIDRRRFIAVRRRIRNASSSESPRRAMSRPLARSMSLRASRRWRRSRISRNRAIARSSAGGSSSGRSGFRRYAITPAPVARSISSSPRWLVKSTIGHGLSAMTARAAATPSPSPRPTAKIATSGRTRPISGTASRELAEEATTPPPAWLMAAAISAWERA